MKNIAVALNAGTPERRNAITNYFSSKNFAFWHWVDDFWIVRVDDSVTAKSLYLLLENLAEINTVSMLVFEFQGQIDFYGRADKVAWNWLEQIGKVSK